MIRLTRRHLDVFMDLWEKTQQGTEAWTGVCRLAGSTTVRAGDILDSMRRKGAIDWVQVHNGRTFRVLLTPSDIEINPMRTKPLTAGVDGKGGRRYEACTRLRDTGRFLAAVRALGLPRYDQAGVAKADKALADDFDTSDLHVRDAKRRAELDWPGPMYAYRAVGVDEFGYFTKRGKTKEYTEHIEFVDGSPRIKR